MLTSLKETRMAISSRLICRSTSHLRIQAHQPILGLRSNLIHHEKEYYYKKTHHRRRDPRTCGARLLYVDGITIGFDRGSPESGRDAQREARDPFGSRKHWRRQAGESA